MDEEEEVSLSMLGQSQDPAAHPRKEGRLMTLETSDLRDHWTLQSHDTERQASDRQHCELALREPSQTAAGFRAQALARLLRGAAPPHPTLWAVWRLDSYLRKLWHRYSWEARGRVPCGVWGFLMTEVRAQCVCLGHRWKGCDVTAFPSWSFPSHLSGAFHQY